MPRVRSPTLWWVCTPRSPQGRPLTAWQLGLDLAISFNVVLYQSLIRIIPLESLPAHLEHGATGQITLSNRFLDDEEEEQGEYQGEPI